LVAAFVAVAVLFTLTTVTAPAEELDDRKRRVQQELREAHRHLNHSSKALVRAGRAVDRAERRLADAEDVLARRRSELGVAAVLDARMQSELQLATARLERAEVALEQGLRHHDDQEQVLRQIAAVTYRSGAPSLIGLSMLLSSRDPAELSSQLNAVRNVLDKEDATLRRLEASRVLLEIQRERVADAMADVRERREDAAQTLAAKQAAEARAERAADRVEELVQQRTRAKRAAAQEKKADQRRLRQLQKERDTITRLLERREAKLRKQRTRAAIAKAKRASRSRNRPLGRPVDGYLTSPFGMRLHPIYRRWTLHDGTDFGAGCGRPVYAAANGTVVAKYYNVGYGRRVVIAHGYMRGRSVSTTYNHLSRYSSHVGQRVRRGEVIGFVGTSGYSTGCHLHFMVFSNGRVVNPMGWL
jgi:murein DD-endopeptidase MepM/ murein hydrolase activator NlpD